MKDRARALDRLKQETSEAQGRFEAEARKRPLLLDAYERWRTEGGEPIGKLLADAPELARLWSAYVRLAACLESAETLPNWPYTPKLAKGDPTPPNCKKKAGS